MVYLADTNILLRSAEPAHPTHSETVKAVSTLLSRGETVCIVPQNIVEFWRVATRQPHENGLGFSIKQTDVEVTRILSLLTLFEDTPAIFPEWRKLVVSYSVKGKQVHDARLAAAMRAHGIPNILTYNKADFTRFDGITSLLPSEV